MDDLPSKFHVLPCNSCQTQALLYYAMVPASSNRVVEMVDMGAVQQQQEAAKGKVGRLLLSGLFNRLQEHWHASAHHELLLPGHN